MELITEFTPDSALEFVTDEVPFDEQPKKNTVTNKNIAKNGRIRNHFFIKCASFMGFFDGMTNDASSIGIVEYRSIGDFDGMRLCE
ncbi:MAG: hypothetical protein ACSW8H_04070 [bacterium]